MADFVDRFFERVLNYYGLLLDVEPLKLAEQKGEKVFRQLLNEKREEEISFDAYLFEGFKKPYDIKELEKKFQADLYRRIKDIENLPQEIRDKIADKRVFALGYASEEVFKLLIPYRRRFGRKIRKAQRDIERAQRKIISEFNYD